MANDFYDYPLYFVVDACDITTKRMDPNKVSPKKMVQGRKKYRLCMNFIMALSTTLNSRCISAKVKKLAPEEVFTYADLSDVHSTQDLIKEVVTYAKKNSHFNNQIAWLHASKAISQKWPCKKFFD
tara:strand:- start:283 stop:660 length:378 start_codon:yes stop_codon:yes gene_type:complete